MTYKIRGKNDVQLTFGDSYKLCIDTIENFFLCSYVLNVTNGATFPDEKYLWDSHNKEKKVMYK